MPEPNVPSFESLTLHQLRIFAAVARYGSFGAAGRALSLSEPSVSAQIKLLERAVDAQLVSRGPGRRRVELTRAGQVLLASSNTIEAELGTCERELQSIRGDRERSLAFGFGPHFPSYPLPSLVSSFRQEHPDIAVRASVLARPELIERLRREELELAAVVGDVDAREFGADLLAEFDVVLVGLPSHPLASVAEAAFDRLSGEPFVMVEVPSATRRVLDYRAAESRIDLKASWESSSDEGLIGAILDGLGIGLVTYTTAAPYLASGAVAMLGVCGFPLRLEWLLVHKRGRLGPAADLFRRYALERRATIEQRTLAVPGQRHECLAT